MDPAGSNSTGLTWGDAFHDLQDAIDLAGPLDFVLVAEGTYHPDPTGLTDPRQATFLIDHAVRLYGGFLGNASGSPSQNPFAPDGSPSNTVLTGDAGTPTNPADDRYHVVRVDGTTISSADLVLLQGFRIEQGRADGATFDDKVGGGVYASDVNLRLFSCTVQDCFADQRGGGVYALNANLGSKLSRFRNNSTRYFGGGICLEGHQDVDSAHLDLRTHLHNVSLQYNNAQFGGGLSVHSPGSTRAGFVELANCIVHDNEATYGGGLSLSANDGSDGDPPDDAASINVVNCTIALNTVVGGAGAGIWGGGSTTPAPLSIRNTIVYFNRGNLGVPNDNVYAPMGSIAWDHCDIGDSQFPWDSDPLVGNVDPRFEDILLRDFRLKWDSACCERGHDGGMPTDVLDLDGDNDAGYGGGVERLPRDFKMLAGGGAPSDREAKHVFPQGSLGFPGDGTGGSVTGAIVDIGAYETPFP